jgi:putative ABC transport system permease protein
VLSNGLWQSHFAGDPRVVGSTIRLGGNPHLVLGVMPKGFFFPDGDAQLWLPLSRRSELYAQVQGLGRLRAGYSANQAQAEIQTARVSPGGASDPSGQIGVFPIHRVVVGQYQLALWTLLGAVSLLLLLACANVANLLLAAGVDRRGELAVRTALGARPRDIFRLVIVESLLLAVLAAVIGVAVAFGSLHVVRSVRLVDLTALTGAGLNRRVLLYAIGVSIAAGIVSGLAPSARACGSAMQSVLQSRSAGAGTRAREGLRELLIAIQVALAVVVVVSAGLLINSFVRLGRADWGFRSDQLLVINLNLPKSMWILPTARGAGTMSPSTPGVALAVQRAYIETLTQRIQGIPGLRQVAVARDMPLQRGEWMQRPISKGTVLAQGRWPLIQVIGPHYFRTMEIPMRGREFSTFAASDIETVVVNQKLADHLWPGHEPIGRRLSILEFDDKREDVKARVKRRDMSVINDVTAYKKLGGNEYEVIGVANNVRMLGLDQDVAPTAYLDVRAWEHSLGTRLLLAVRLDAVGEDVPDGIQNAVASVRSDVSLQGISRMDELVGRSIGGRGSNKLMLVTSIGFGVICLLLCGLGVYAVVAYTTAQRTRELGIRLALGASPIELMRLVVRQSTRSMAWGCVLGLVSAWAVTRLFQSLLFGVSATDPFTFIGVVCLVATVTLVASLVPSYQASRLSIVDALRRD